MGGELPQRATCQNWERNRNGAMSDDEEDDSSGEIAPRRGSRVRVRAMSTADSDDEWEPEVKPKKRAKSKSKRGAGEDGEEEGGSHRPRRRGKGSKSKSTGSGDENDSPMDFGKTSDYELKLLELKKKLAWQICHHLGGGRRTIVRKEHGGGGEEAEDAGGGAMQLDDDDGADEAIGGSGSGENGEALASIAAAASSSSSSAPVVSAEDKLQAQNRREAKMVRELDRVMARIKEARSEYGKADEVFGTNAAMALAQRFVCRKCGNRDPELIFADPRTGDTICRGREGLNNCGEVVQDHFINSGEAHRNFEDGEDRNHHGPKRDALMPDSVNMRTSIGDGFHDNDRSNKFRKLQELAMQAEMDLSNIGKDGRASTRVGYKTNQKFKAFRLMADLASSLHIHEAVIERAKEEFAKYREVRERIENFEATVVGCILFAYLDLATEMNLDIKISDKVSHRDLGPSLSYTEQLASITQSDPSLRDDAAIHTLPHKRMKDFTKSEIRQWLVAVAGGDGGVHATEAGLIASYVDKVISGEEKIGAGISDDSKKRKASELPFVLHAGSSGNRSRQHSIGAAVPKSVCNLLLVEPKIASILSGSSGSSQVSSSSSNGSVGGTSAVFCSAILRRSRFDVAQKSAQTLEELESRRKSVEKADVSQTRAVQISQVLAEEDEVRPAPASGVLASGSTNEAKATDPSLNGNAAAVDFEDELFGGAQQGTFFHFGKSAPSVQQSGRPVQIKAEPKEEGTLSGGSSSASFRVHVEVD